MEKSIRFFILYVICIALFEYSCKEDNLRYLSGPLEITIDSVTSYSISISWNSIEGAAIYSIDAGTDTTNRNDFEEVATTTELYYHHSNLIPNTRYYFLVGAHPEMGNPVSSGIVTAITLSVE